MTTMKWGEELQVFMELGFPVNPFTLDSPTLGILDQNYLEGTLIGDDVSPYAQELSISRGRTDQLQNFNAGTMTITLSNTDRRFDPINELSPYWNPVTNNSGVEPRRKVTVVSRGVTVFVGRITDIDVSYDHRRAGSNLENSIVNISASDDFVLLASTYIADDITPSVELSGSRVNYILDLPEVGFGANRDIDTGIAELGAYQIDANTNALQYLQDISNSEQGLMYITGDGNLRFTDRVIATLPNISAEFADDGTDLPYTKLIVAYGQELLYNRVTASAGGGEVQVANKIASQDEYGISTLDLGDLLLSFSADALALVEDLVEKYREPEYRFDHLQTIYNRLDGADQDTVSALEIGDVVDVTRTFPTGYPLSVTKQYQIQAIRHSISNNQHTVEFGLRFIPIVYQFILDDPTFGRLNANNVLT